MLVKDLFGDIVDPVNQDEMDQNESESEEDEFGGQDESFKMADNLASGYFDAGASQEKSYTLTMICDPDDSGIDKKFREYREWLQEKEGQNGLKRPKRLVINANQNLQSTAKKGGAPLLLSAAEDDKFRRQHQQIGKVVFLKDRDIEINAFEKEISKWVPQFHYKMHQLCSRRPRFSEMRPTKYNA